MRYFLFCGRYAVLLCFFLNPAHAIDSNPQLLTLQDALRYGLQQHPQLDSFKLRAQSLRGEMESAALSPPLTLSADMENIAGSRGEEGTRNAEFTLSLSSVIEARHQRNSRQSVITARQRALATEEEVFALDLLTDITQQFISVIAAQEALTIHQHSLQLWQNAVSALQQRVDAGRSPTAELLRAKAAQGQAAIALIEAQKNLTLTKMALCKLWGEPDDIHFVAQGELRDVGKSESLEHILGLVARHPDLRLLTEETRLRAAELRMARSNSSLKPEWQAGVRYLQENDDTALVFGVSLPLAHKARSSGQVKAATAQHQLALQQQAAALVELRSQIAQLHEEHRVAIQRTSILHNDVVPLLSRSVEETNRAFRGGRYSYMEWSLANEELLTAELQLIRSAEQAHYWRAEIERLSGSMLFSDDDNLQSNQGVTP